MDSIVTQELPVSPPRRDPSDDQVKAASELLAQLSAEAGALGQTAAAAKVHSAMGRVYAEQLGDLRSAAVCFENAFLLDPQYKPNLESARRLFAGAGQHERSLALHQREAALLKDPAQRAESLRAQAAVLERLGKPAEAAQRIEEALALMPDHPALLKASAAATLRAGDSFGAAKLLVRSAGATLDPVYKAQLLRRAVLLTEALEQDLAGAESHRPTPGDLAALHEEALRKLFQADANDEVGFQGMLESARSSNDWEAVLRLCRQRAGRTGSAADRALVAAVAAYRLGRVSEGLAEISAALEDSRRDGALLALRAELAEQQKAGDLAEILRQRAEGCIEPSERAHLKLRVAMLVSDPLEKEQVLSESLAENPGDAAAIALHARLVAERDPVGAGERFAELGESLEAHSAQEAAAHYLEAGVWQERAGNRAEAATLAHRALQLVPLQPAALRLLTRTLPSLGRSSDLADLLEDAAARLPRALGAELLARAGALVADGQAERAAALARRAAEMARGLMSPRWLETWSTLAFKAGDLAQLSQALEARADCTHGADAAELLLEASELSRAVGDDPRSTALLRKARGVDPASAAARNALLALPALPVTERIELLAEEARQTVPERAAALHAERAAMLDAEGRTEEAVQACAQALAISGVDLAVLRRLARLQLRRGDHAAALAVLVQIAQALPEANQRAEAYGRAAEVAEWRAGDAGRAAELYRLAAEAHPRTAFAWAQLARLLSWTSAHAEAASAWERLAEAATSLSERIEARRWAASLYANRAAQPEKAAGLLRALLAEAPGDLEAAASLLALIGDEQGAKGRSERAELRGRLASHCQDPRVAALLRAESAEDRLAAGELDQAVAEYRRALALNPQDRIALDRVEQALRESGEQTLLAEHLAFRCSFADPETRAALSLEQAEIFTGLGRLQEAFAAYRQALDSDPESLVALKGARHIAEVTGDKQEAMRLLSKEASVVRSAGAMVEAALLAEDMGSRSEAIEHLAAALQSDPANAEAAGRLRGMLGDDAARTLGGIYEKVGHGQADDKLGALAWTQASAIELRELNDAPAAFFAAGRALSRDPSSAAALVLRADAAEAAHRPGDAAEALQKLLDAAPDDARAGSWKPRLGRLYAEVGEAEKALPLLAPLLDALEPALLWKVAPGAQSLPAAEAVRIYTRLLEGFPEAAQPGPAESQLAEWGEALARRQLALGNREQALKAFRRVLRHDPHSPAALRNLMDLGTRDDAVAAQRAYLEISPAPEPLHALVKLFEAQASADAAFCAAAALAGLGLATPEERALYDAGASKPPPVELPRLREEAVRAPGDEAPARDLLAAAAVEVTRALPTDMSGGRGALVRGDNPVRRVVAALSRALGMAEPQLFLARAEPAIVTPVAGDAPGLLVGSEVPKRWSPRQQRFLYGRALAHLRRGTQALLPLSPARLASLTAELARLTAPEGTDLSRLPRGDAALAEALAAQLDGEARARLSPLAARVAEAETDWEELALGLRESADRAGLAVCGDPAAGVAIVAGEVRSGLDHPEVARLVRFAVSESFGDTIRNLT